MMAVPMSSVQKLARVKTPTVEAEAVDLVQTLLPQVAPQVAPVTELLALVLQPLHKGITVVKVVVELVHLLAVAAVAVLVALEVRAQTQELPQVLVAPVPQRLSQGLL
jgi:hypothetical protein